MYYPSKQEFVRLAKKGNLIPVYRELLADLETPVSAFLKIDSGQYSFLLESVEGGEKIARYSFLAAEPSLVFRSKGRKIEIITPQNKSSFFTQSQPLMEIKKILDAFHFVPIKGLPRFCGGFVGYLGYEMIRFFEDLPPHRTDDLRLPDSIFMLAETIVIFDHLNHKIKVVANAYIENRGEVRGSREQAERAYEKAVKKIEEIIKKLQSPLTLRTDAVHSSKKYPLSVKFRSNFTKDEFKKAIIKTKEYIRKGDIIQAVLSQRFRTKLYALPLDVYRWLRSINPSPYMYYLKFKDLVLIGSSPEVFVRCEEGKVELRPIAGTRPRGRDEEQDRALEQELLNSQKERAEHIMLVDLGRNDIGRVCEYGTVKVLELMVIERYSHVMHIVSDVVGRLKRDRDEFDLIKATFPAGTVTGAPKIRAMEIIAELEEISRGPYAGCVGYFSFSGNLDSCITIRTIIVKKGEAFVQAGAGIVADSRPEFEYQETLNKATAMLRAVELANRGIVE